MLLVWCGAWPDRSNPAARLCRTLCQQLEVESGIVLEPPVVVRLRSLVLEGSWDEAEPLLEKLDPNF